MSTPPTEVELLEQRIRISKLLPGQLRSDSTIRKMEEALRRLRRPRLVVVNPPSPKGQIMADESSKPKIELVLKEGEEPKRPRTATLFDDVDKLRKDNKLTVRRKGLLTHVEVGRPSSECHFRCSSGTPSTPR